MAPAAAALVGTRVGRALQMLACGSLVAGTVHAALCPSHFREATVFGVFFAVVATLQLAWAGLILSRPSRWLLEAGAFGSLATIAVAEGVETEAQAVTLTDLGCPLAQGYLFSRPVNAKAMTALLSHPDAERSAVGV